MEQVEEMLQMLLSWATDMEDLMTSQKPPSSEVKVVRAQLQEQKVRVAPGAPLLVGLGMGFRPPGARRGRRSRQSLSRAQLLRTWHPRRI